MIRLALRTARENGTRQVLAALAVLLGVAFISGTLIFTDGAQQAMYDRANSLNQKTSVAVTASDNDEGGHGLSAELLTAIRQVDGVAAAEGVLVGPGGLTNPAGKRPPAGWISAIPVDPALQSYEVATGRLPRQPGEVAIDARTASRYGYHLGNTVMAGGSGGEARPYLVVGQVDMSGTQFDGRPFIGMVPADALMATGQESFRQIVVAATSGVPDETLARRVEAVVAGAGVVRTHSQIVDQTLREAFRNVAVIRNALLMFVLVSVLTAGFVIANTFTIVLAQRTRQIALLRLVGATRGQAFRLVLLEAAVIGAFASLAGALVGIGVAEGLGKLLEVLATPLAGGLVLEPRTLLIAVATGIGVTLGAALMPAWRGTRVPPVAALTAAEAQVIRPAGRYRILFGVALLVLAAIALAYAGVAGNAAVVAAIGIAGFFGITALGPVLVPVLIRSAGWPIERFFGATARLAVRYAARNRRRVAATATTLILCVSLVSAIMIGAFSVKAGIEKKADERFGADFVVTGAALPDRLIDALRARPELGVVHSLRGGLESGLVVQAAHPVLLARTSGTPVAGVPADLRDGTAAVTEPLAISKGWHVGAAAHVKGRTYRVIAVLPARPADGRPAELDQRIMLTERDVADLFPHATVGTVEIKAAPGIPSERAAEAVQAVVDVYPAVAVMDLSAYKQTRTAGLDQLLMSIIALLALAVVIALVGVANTLALSVVERTREHGMLRAIGLTRYGLRLMLAIEAVLIALIGVVLGLGLGIAVAAGATNLLKVDGPVTLVLPWSRMLLIVLLTVLAALAASLSPSARASRQSIVETLAKE